MSFFSVEDLSVAYGKTEVLQNVSFSLEGGTVTGILGANGCGKSTLLRAICGLLPHTGRCTLKGQTLEELSTRQRAQCCSYVPQRSGITIELSVLDVVMMGFHAQLRLLEQPSRAMREQARQALRRVGLSGREDECFLNLSEGEKQLCILARTLVSGGRLLLLDEPESALDFRRRYEMLEMLHDWAAETGGSVLAVLHDPDLALRSCDRLLLLHRGGEIAALHPKTDPRDTLEAALSRIYGPVTLSERGPGEYAMWKEG